VAIIFCGSKKSLSQGVTMAKVIFASHGAGAVILPLMVFHQIQLMVCAALAQRWAHRAEFAAPASAGTGPAAIPRPRGGAIAKARWRACDQANPSER
jgi:sodium/bile acid cotransporter 7